MGPYTVIEISEIFGQRVSDVVSFLDAPAFNVDIWRMVSEVLDLIDKRTGLTELLYGLSGGTQIRSATEADVRNQNVSVRPDDMASRVEDWLSHCAMKEMEAAEWSLSGQDVQPILGDVGALIWEQRIQSQEFERTVMDFDYRIEAGSARKPNKTNRVRQLNEFGQIVMPMLQQFVQMGIDQPYNSFVRDWAKANELDAEPYLINMAEIKQQEEQAQQGKPNPEEQAQQMQQQMQQQQMQMEQQKMQMEMQAKQAELQIKQQEMQMKKAESEAKQEEIRAKQRQGDESARIAATKSQIESQKIQLEQQIHIQEMRQDSEKHQQEMAQERERHQMELEFMKAKSEAERRKAQQTNDS